MRIVFLIFFFPPFYPPAPSTLFLFFLFGRFQCESLISVSPNRRLDSSPCPASVVRTFLFLLVAFQFFPPGVVPDVYQPSGPNNKNYFAPPHFPVPFSLLPPSRFHHGLLMSPIRDIGSRVPDIKYIFPEAHEICGLSYPLRCSADRCVPSVLSPSLLTSFLPIQQNRRVLCCGGVSVTTTVEVVSEGLFPFLFSLDFLPLGISFDSLDVL